MSSDLSLESGTSIAPLRVLAETPLLCALLCALNRDRRGRTTEPDGALRHCVGDVARRRGAEQGVIVDTVLSRTQKTLLLQDLAYWLIRNGWSDADRSSVHAQIEVKLQQMTQIMTGAVDVYQHLLERSGLLREPVAGRVDFVHRTFQEYLAALDALAADDLGVLVQHAHEEQWREVVIMAVGHAYARKREELLHLLVQRGRPR